MLDNLRRKSVKTFYASTKLSLALKNGNVVYNAHAIIDRHTKRYLKTSKKAEAFKSDFCGYLDSYKNKANRRLTQKIRKSKKTGGGSITFDMIRCEPGVLLQTGYMDEGCNPERFTRIKRPFLIGEAPVTQELYMEMHHNQRNPSGFQEQNKRDYSQLKLYPFSLQHPVERVCWVDAIRFCNALSKKQNLEACYTQDDASADAGWICDFTKNGYRLPTEAEWEYAAKALDTDVYSYVAYLNASIPTNKGAYAWHRENSKGSTHPVGTKEPNTWGIRDMLGNVYEMCWDTYYTGSSQDADAPRVLRGCAYNSDLEDLDISKRNGQYPNPIIFQDTIGFRLARTIVE